MLEDTEHPSGLHDAPLQVEVSHVVRAVFISQLIFAVGHTLTSGAFFSYFVYQFGPSAFLLGVLLSAAELAGSFSVLGRWIALRLGNRKRIWIIFLISGRLAGMMIPLALLWPTSTSSEAPLLYVLICTLVWNFLQGVAYINYISWLSDLVPRGEWGRLFSRRQIAITIISLFAAVVVAEARRQYLRELPDWAARWSYAVIFLVGGILAIVGIVPLLGIPHVPWTPTPWKLPEFGQLRSAMSRSFLCLLTSRWWLAFFQGLTQAALFKYAVDHVGVPLNQYTWLIAIMLILQLPATWWAGRISDRGRDKQGLIWGMLLVAAAIPIWLLAGPETWQLLFLAWGLWGAFGLVNVCGHNLCLKLSPPGDNSGQFALYDQVSGLIAGGAGILGGYLLQSMIEASQVSASSTTTDLLPYQILLTVSFIGRVTAPLWLLPIRTDSAGSSASST